MLFSDRADFRARKSISNEEKHYEMIKGPDFQEVVPILNM